MVTRIDFNTLTFGEPLYLWLLAVPGVLLALWVLQVVRRRADTQRYAQLRVVPVRERFTLFGDLSFWLALILAASLCIVALARPQARVVIVRKAGADIVILQDGSASMYVKDVKPDRWRRSSARSLQHHAGRDRHVDRGGLPARGAPAQAAQRD